MVRRGRRVPRRIFETEPDFLDAFHEHEHDDHVPSVALVTEEALDPAKFLPWSGMVVQQFGPTSCA